MRKALIMLGEMSDSDMAWLAMAGVRLNIPAGHKIIDENSPLTAMFIILEGRAAVLVRGIEIAMLASGELLGEVSMIDSRPTSAAVIAVDDVVLLSIDRAALKTRLATDLDFGCRFYHAVAIFLADRLRGANAKLAAGVSATAVDDDDSDEIDLEVLDRIHLAGAKFDLLLHRTLKST